MFELLRLLRFLEVFERHNQHPKTLPLILALVFVMHLMRLSDGSEVPIVGIVKPFETSMDEHIMYQEIGNSIEQNAQSDIKPEIIARHHAKHDEQPTGDGINQKKYIIAFKNVLVRFMVILVEIPHKAMHYKAMRSPRHPFHDEERTYGYQPIHCLEIKC
jgi:hypothetical protein